MSTGPRPTDFAPAERVTGETLLAQARTVEAHPLAAALLDSFPEPAVILNSQRQIVMANQRLADLLGKDRGALLGVRPGEALGCAHAFEHDAGCGTTVFCRECGAANAILARQREQRQEVRECRIHCVAPDGTPSDLDLRVWATPLLVDGEPYTVFAVRDTTDENRRRVLERMFFHDVLNLAGGLKGILGIWHDLTGQKAVEMEAAAVRTAAQLVEEIEAQRDLAAAERGDLAVNVRTIDAESFLAGLCVRLAHDPAAAGRKVAPPALSGHPTFRSDPALLDRVLGNLLKNALEASRPGQTVRVGYFNLASPVFQVHNESAMPESVQLRMFQRSFSTKAAPGHGVGTYSVKLLAERYLGGRVSFRSTPELGTTFTVELP